MTGSAARDAATKNPLAEMVDSEAADRLKAELQEYLAAQAQRLLAGVGRKLGESTAKLTDIADGKSPGFAQLALETGRKVTQGKGPLRSVVEAGATHAKDNVLGAFKGLGGKGGKDGKSGKGKRSSGSKPTVIIEHLDVGVPLRTAYDQWTRYEDFSTFAKGVQSASRDDDTHSAWQAKVLWSNRSWKATTTEQVPDDRIAWTSEGAKGTTKGVVSFHRIAENLTRVVLVIEYYPSGFFEKTGNIWRAQGRRARLDLKNFARFITFKGEVEDGWRGEIRDAEVVRDHEEAVAEEEEASGQDETGGSEEDEEAETAEEPEPDDEYEEEDEDEDEDDDAENTYEDDDESVYEDDDEYAEDGSRR